MRNPSLNKLTRAARVAGRGRIGSRVREHDHVPVRVAARRCQARASQPRRRQHEQHVLAEAEAPAPTQRPGGLRVLRQPQQERRHLPLHHELIQCRSICGVALVS